MRHIPDFTEAEMWIVHNTLRERYGRDIETHQADAEIRIRPHDRELTLCPTLYWQIDDCSFAIFKTKESRYRCQFFYSVRHQYGTGIPEYTDLSDCVVTLLQVQADHARERQQEAGSEQK